MTAPRNLTNKSQVLAVYQHAYAVQQSGGSWYIWDDVYSTLKQDDPSGIIGRGYSAVEAWRNAARRLLE